MIVFGKVICMSEIFLRILNTSIAASWLVLAVLLLRVILRRAPKWTVVLLWGIVAIRMICPFSIESALSLIPSKETFPQEVITGPSFDIQTGIVSVDSLINEYLGDHYFEGVTVPTDNGFRVITLLAIIWCIGVLSLILYAGISYFRLRSKINTAVRYNGNVYQNENVRSPFVLGIYKPRIYLPFKISSQAIECITAHEQAHIKRGDHLWKPIGFLLLNIHWFNPLMWVAYTLLCRDIELACDEKVIKDLGNEQKANYVQTLVDCSNNRHFIPACPLAFSEIGVKERVRSVMNYKKPAAWVIILAIILCVGVAICFLTDPNPAREITMTGNNIADLEPNRIVKRILDIEDWESSNVYVNSNNFALTVDSDFNWVNSQTIRYFFSNAHSTYHAQLRIFPSEGKYVLMEPADGAEQGRIFLLQHYLEAVKHLPQDAIKQMVQAERYLIRQIDGGQPSDYEKVIMYSLDGIQRTDGWYLHLQIDPVHYDGEGYSGIGDEAIHLFYGPTPS